MKKQFFYAAMAIAMMASCTSEDDLVVNPVEPNQEEEKVALNLSVATPSMTVGSRATGTGMVGEVVDNPTETATTSWDNQELYMTMVDRKDGTEYKENGTAFFDGLTFRAPKDGASDKNIRIYNSYENDSEGHGDGEGTLQYKYYPITGTYDFYGWHIDKAQWDNTKSFSSTEAMVTNITIDGTQDIMAAKTVAIPSTKPTEATAPYYTAANAITDNDVYADMVAKQFSARTARNNFTPILDFKHSLARLKFYVRSGKGSDAAINWVDKNGVPQERTQYDDLDAAWENQGQYAAYAAYADGAIYVTEVKVLNMVQTINLDLKAQTAAVAANNTNTEFTLMSTPTQAKVSNTKTLQKLVYTAPKFAWGHSSNLDGTKATEVGESVMFLPNATDETNKKIKISVKVGQCLIDTENETTDEFTYKWDEPEATVLWVDASKLTIDGVEVPATEKEFKAGKSYNVYITIYGRERIEVSATLAPWVEGGNVETDIEDNVVTGEEDEEDEEDEETATVKEYTMNPTFNPATDTQLTVSYLAVDEDEEEIQSATNTLSLKVGKTYTITATADGYIGTVTKTVSADDSETTIDITLDADTTEP